MGGGQEFDVTDWPNIGEEPMGEPGKAWLEEPDTGHRWLFKPVRLQNDSRGPFRQGDDWAEKIAADAAALIGLPAAKVELARRGERVGALSRDMTGGGKLTLGNELMWAHDHSYPTMQVGQVPEYTLERIFEVLEVAEVRPSGVAKVLGQTTRSLFAGYLLLDAWIANQDRHHGNWGVIEDPLEDAPPTLAASFDHGSSLGFQLHDDSKADILHQRRLERWVGRGMCRPMAGQPRLVDLAAEAMKRAGPPARYWVEHLATLTPEDLCSVVAGVADGRMSHSSRTFAIAVLDTNRRRLLDGI